MWFVAARGGKYFVEWDLFGMAVITGLGSRTTLFRATSLIRFPIQQPEQDRIGKSERRAEEWVQLQPGREFPGKGKR